MEFLLWCAHHWCLSIFFFRFHAHHSLVFSTNPSMIISNAKNLNLIITTTTTIVCLHVILCVYLSLSLSSTLVVNRSSSYAHDLHGALCFRVMSLRFFFFVSFRDIWYLCVGWIRRFCVDKWNLEKTSNNVSVERRDMLELLFLLSPFTYVSNHCLHKIFTYYLPNVD